MDDVDNLIIPKYLLYENALLQKTNAFEFFNGINDSIDQKICSEKVG